MNVLQNQSYGFGSKKSMQEMLSKIDGTTIIQRALGQYDTSTALKRALGSIDTSTALKRALGQYDTSTALKRALGSIDTSTTLKRALSEYETFQPLSKMLASREMSEVYESFIDQLDRSSIEEMFDSIVQESTETDLEEYGDKQSENETSTVFSDEDAEWVDPIRYAAFEKSAEWLIWFQERYPAYSERAIHGLNGIVQNIFIGIMAQVLPFILITCFGPVGLVYSGVIFGTAIFISAAQKKKLSQQSQNGISIECPMCHAIPGMWCITVRGSAPGSPASKMHQSRTN